MKRALAVAALTIALATSSVPALAAPARAVPQPVSRTAHAQSGGPEASIGVIVKFKQPSNAMLGAKLLATSTDTSAAPLDAKRGLYAFSSSHTASDRQYAAQLMLTAPGVAYAEPDYVRSLASYSAPTDPDFTDLTTWVAYGSDYYPGGKHWWLNAIKAPNAWAVGQGASYPVRGSAGSVKIAVIDTGIYLTHPDLNGGAVVAGRDECASYDPNTGIFTTDANITPDTQADLSESSHGTGVAAAAGGEVDGVGMVGSGWNPTVVGYKVAGPITAPWGTYPTGSILILDGAAAQAIYDAVDAGCKVLNLSLAGPAYSQAYTDAIAYAHSRGAVVVCAVGNEGDTTVNYPAATPYALGVGATQLSGSASTPGIAFFSDYAPGVVDLVAPGETFWTADKPDWDSDGTGTVSTPGYQFWSGTSFASPAAAGAIAYLWRAMPDLTNDQIVSYVESSAVDMGTPGRDDYFGYGLVDMQAAYNRLIADYPMLSTPALGLPAFAGSHQATITWDAVPGYNVNYRVSVDGVLRATTSATSLVATGLADGAHSVSVMPASVRNWNTTTTAATGTLVEDSVSPLVGGFTWDTAKFTWTVSDTNTCTVQARIDNGNPSSLATNTLTPGAITPGAHVLYVSATDGAGNTSGWTPYAFSVTPSSPVVPDVNVSDATAAAVSWSAVPGATSYDYRVNGGAVASTTATSFVAGGLVGGSVPVSVRSVAGTTTSAWTAATINDAVVVPATPVPSAPATVTLPSVTVSWPAATAAKSYEARLDGGPSVATAALSASFALPIAGAHTVAVRSLDNLARSTWATVTVSYTAPMTLTLSAITPSVSFPASQAVLTAFASAPNETVDLERSVDGGSTWKATGVTLTTTDAPAAVQLTAPIGTTTAYRLSFAGDSRWAAAVSSPAIVTYDSTVPAPVVPSVVVTDAPLVTVTWAPVTGASSYEYRVGDGPAIATTGTSFSSGSIGAGVTNVGVRAIVSGVASSWSYATITDNVVVPGKPVLSVPSNVLAPSVTVTWAPTAYALTYEVKLDDALLRGTDDPWITVPLTLGTHVVYVRAINHFSESAWTTASVTYTAPPLPAPKLTLAASADRIFYPTQSLVLFAGCSAASRTARVQSSADGLNWSDVPNKSFTTTSAPASVAVPVGVARIAYFRVVFAGDAEYSPSISPVIRVNYVPRLVVSSAPKRVTRRHKFTVTATVSAPAANTGSPVTFRFMRWQKVRGRYQWANLKTVRARGKVKNAAAVTYSVRTSLYPAGKWRVVTSYPGVTGLYGATTGSARAISVR